MKQLIIDIQSRLAECYEVNSVSDAEKAAAQMDYPIIIKSGTLNIEVADVSALLQQTANALGSATKPVYIEPKVKATNLQYIDIDWGQLDLFEKPPVKFPCALIEIRQAGYTDEGQHAQIGVITIEIRIADMVLSNSSFKAPASQKERALSIFDLVSNVYSLLHGWHAPDSRYGELTRTNLQKTTRDDGLKEYRLLYNVQLSDTKARRKVTLAPLNDINVFVNTI